MRITKRDRIILTVGFAINLGVVACGLSYAIPMALHAIRSMMGAL